MSITCIRQYALLTNFKAVLFETSASGDDCWINIVHKAEYTDIREGRIETFYPTIYRYGASPEFKDIVDFHNQSVERYSEPGVSVLYRDKPSYTVPDVDRMVSDFLAACNR